MRAGRLVLAAAVLGVAAPGSAGAQMLGLPVLQNAFVAPGVTVAADFGSSRGATTFGAAATWGPGSGRFQLSGGVGAFDPDEGDVAVTYGARAAAPVAYFGADNQFGVAVFAGAGGASVADETVINVPVGVGAGYVRRLGEESGFSVYASPFLSWTRRSPSVGDDISDTLFRVGLGLDYGFTASLGASVGVELGAEARPDQAGPVGPVVGVALSYAFGR